jgi:hypothetical protein
MPHAHAPATRPQRHLPAQAHLARMSAAAAALAMVCADARATDALPPATAVYGAGVWRFDTPQVFGTDSVLELQITGIGGGPCDPCHPLLVFEQGVQFGGALRVTMVPGDFVYGSQGYTLFSYWQSLPEGQFSTVQLPGLPDGLGWATDLYISGSIRALQPVPEPAAWALWLAALGAGAGLAQRARQAVRTA